MSLTPSHSSPDGAAPTVATDQYFTWPSGMVGAPLYVLGNVGSLARKT
jgi:hypothetical protein